MAKYRVQITFTGNPNAADELIIKDALGGNLFVFTFYVPPSSSPGVTGVRVDSPFQATNYNLRESFRVRYNLSGYYSVSPGADVTTIEGEFPDGSPTTDTLPTNVTVTYTLLADPFAITSTSFTANGTDVCGKVDLVVNTDNNFNEVVSPVAETFTDTNTHTITNLDRQRFYNIVLRDSNGQTVSKNLRMPSYLTLANITVEIISNSVYITDSLSGLALEYSLDNSNWQSENVFTNLVTDDYTLYIRDQFGCSINTTFKIIESVDSVITIPDPYFKYSKMNPLRIADRVGQWDEVTVFRNADNTLSCEELDDVAYGEIQRFRSSDVISMKVRSNYDDLDVITTDDSTSQTPIQLTANIGNKIAQDCKVVDLGDYRFGVYFISGKTYNYDTLADLGEDYVLGGKLPLWAKVGQVVTIDSINYPIEEVELNEELNVEHFIISSTNLSGDSNEIIKAIYNIEDYEVYEFLIPCVGRDEFSVEIWYDGSLQKKSESILVDDVSENLIHIQWEMNFNTDYLFLGGTVPYARMLVDTIKAGIKNEGEAFETDTDSKLIDSNNFEVDVIKFLPVTKELARHLIMWLSCQELTIRGIPYRKESIELESLERSNLYVVSATLIVRNSGLDEENSSIAEQEILELLVTESDEFIKTM